MANTRLGKNTQYRMLLFPPLHVPRLTSIRIPIIKMRRSHDRLIYRPIFIMEITYLQRPSLH